MDMRSTGSSRSAGRTPSLSAARAPGLAGRVLVPAAALRGQGNRGRRAAAGPRGTVLPGADEDPCGRAGRGGRAAAARRRAGRLCGRPRAVAAADELVQGRRADDARRRCRRWRATPASSTTPRLRVAGGRRPAPRERVAASWPARCSGCCGRGIASRRTGCRVAPSLPGLGGLAPLWRPGARAAAGRGPRLVVDLRSGAYAALARVPGAVEVRVLRDDRRRADRREP